MVSLGGLLNGLRERNFITSIFHKKDNLKEYILADSNSSQLVWYYFLDTVHKLWMIRYCFDWLYVHINVLASESTLFLLNKGYGCFHIERRLWLAQGKQTLICLNTELTLYSVSNHLSLSACMRSTWALKDSMGIGLRRSFTEKFREVISINDDTQSKDYLTRILYLFNKEIWY